MKTYVPSKGEIEKKWWLVNAEGKTLGRLCTKVVEYLTGKKKATYAPFIDVGDHVIIINASKVVLTGNKLEEKMYRHYSGYPGGLKEIAAGKLLSRNPEMVIEMAVWGMLPKTKLGKAMLKKLKVYPGSEHPHAAQRPEEIKL
ncbi:MAG: 50S ribosomal protein L13 [Acidobacteriota bacterium]